MVEEWARGEIWWQNIPFGWIAIAMAAFGLGCFWTDLQNRQSWIRELYRNYTQLFEVESTNVLAAPLFGVYSRIRFLRRIREATILLHISGYAGRTIVYERNSHKANGEELMLRIIGPDTPTSRGTVELMWNIDRDESWMANYDQEYVFTVEVQHTWPWWKQKFSWYIRTPKPDSLGSGFIVLGQNRDVFDSKTLPIRSAG